MYKLYIYIYIYIYTYKYTYIATGMRPNVNYGTRKTSVHVLVSRPYIR